MALAREIIDNNIKQNKVTKMQTRCGYAIEQFLQEYRKKSANTEINYRGDINRFLDIVFNKTINTITFEELDCLDFDSLTQYINNEFEGMSNNTINRHLSSIKAVYRHLKTRGEGNNNFLKSDISYFDLVTMLPNDSERIMRMPIDICDQYIEEAGHERFDAFPKQMIIKLAADTGFRLSDYLSLKWSQFHPEGSEVVISGYGKGGKRFTDKISVSLYNELLKLKNDQEYGERKVFHTLTERKVKGMMTRIRENLGYDDRAYSFHSLKKTAVTFAYRLTGDILEAQRKGHHSKLETTRDYLEDVDYGVTGMYSLGDFDSGLYKKASHEELMEVLEGMNKDMLHLLNIGIANLRKQNNTK